MDIIYTLILMFTFEGQDDLSSINTIEVTGYEGLAACELALEGAMYLIDGGGVRILEAKCVESTTA